MSSVEEDKRKLFIGGLSFNTTNESMKRAFEKYGPVQEG
jgi:RNA recognition motif-containing protein